MIINLFIMRCVKYLILRKILANIFFTIYKQLQIMEEIQNRIKKTEQNISHIKQNLNNKNNISFEKNSNKRNDIEDQLQNISSFLQESSQQKNSINNELFSLKRSKSSLFFSTFIFF